MGIFQNDRGTEGGGGLGGRFIGAIIIAIIGLIMYMTQVQDNPVTHEKQHVAISPAQEVRLGLESAPLMSKEMGGEVPASDPRSIEVKKIGEEIVNNTDAKKSPWKFQFHLLADQNTINAFALPGGQVFITLGLLNKLQTEAQLAGVLSHEMGHVIERHTAQQMAKSQLGQMLVLAVGTGASDPRNPSTLYSPMVLASVVNHMFQLHYSREDESEADLWGLKLMSQVGYNPRAMIQVMEILKASGPRGHMPELFQTHPNPDLRIQQINKYLTENPPKQGLKEGRKLKDIFSSQESST